MNTFAEVASQFVGKPYKLGKAKVGYDCFSLVYNYLRKRGIDLPTTFKDFTLTNYSAVFINNPDHAKEVMVEFMSTVLEETTNPVGGDILLLCLRGQPSAYFLAIDAGNGQALISTEEQGVTVISLEFYTIKRSWKCQQQSQ